MRLYVIIMLVFFACLASPALAQETDTQPQLITAGTYSGFIDDTNSTDRYAIELTAGQEVTIRMEAGEDSTLDAWLFLFDNLSKPFLDDDDSGGNRNAEITFTVARSGLYIIEATRFQQNLGDTSGTYLLTVTTQRGNQSNPDDPLSFAPPFTVTYTAIDLGATVTGTLDDDDDLQYYVVGAQQGNFLRFELAHDNTLDATVRLFTRIDQNLNDISRPAESSPTRDVIVATIPQTAWYLVEVQRQSGSGDYELRSQLVSDILLSSNSPTEVDFAAGDTLFFVFNATINERVFVNVSVVGEGTGIIPELSIFDLNQIRLEEPISSQGQQTRISLTAPRSSAYIVQARNLGNGAGVVEVQIRRVAAATNKLQVTPATYNDDYRGTIDDNNPIDYYRFSGKAGELVTIQLSPEGSTNSLDPYIILADSNLTELIFNDNVSVSRTARITQFALPSDGDYFILATRSGLSRGITDGDYLMTITVGEIKLETGALTATLTWEGNADLNLFVQTPSNFTLSWANPTQDNGGVLQIDSNTDCNTPTAQPIEHIYWQEVPELGDYVFWVWYQDTCEVALETPFTLVVTFNDQVILTRTNTERETLDLSNGQRYETSIRLTSNETAVVVNRGSVSRPSAQETASQGGDTLIVYGEEVSDSISDQIFAQFYQFEGQAGDTVRITATQLTGTLDPVVVLRDSNNQTLASNDDLNPDNHNAAIVHTLDKDGRYVIAVTRYGVRDGTTVGTYSLTLEQVP